jgi:DNA-binding CsgD family transcriptional regulator/PAS domain-containing protein
MKPRSPSTAYYHAKDVWIARALDRGILRPVVGQELISTQELVRTEFYNDFCRRLGVHHLVGGQMPLEKELVATIGIQRPRSSPEFEDGDKRLCGLLLPHLGRAVQLYRHIKVIHRANRAAWDALDSLRVGVLLVDSRGKVLFANAIADRVLRAGRGLVVRNSRLHAQDSRQDPAVQQAIADAQLAAAGRSLQAGTVLPIRRADRQPLSLLICPAPRNLADVFARDCGAVIFVTDPVDQRPLPEALLARYYGLTPAEARLLEALVAGARLQDYAELAGITFHTARNHLRRVFAKTDFHRQSDLVRDVLGNPVLRLALEWKSDRREVGTAGS